MMTKSYSELSRLKTFEERLEYLRVSGKVGEATFGGHRKLNQILYQTDEWKKVRRKIIIRDEGFDLGHSDYPIFGPIYIHHINPITVDDILRRRYCVFDLDNLISCSFDTHNSVHYGTNQISRNDFVERRKNDTCPWR